MVAGTSYGIVVWAMHVARLSHVAALRETSVIIAALIGTFVLREAAGGRHIAAAVLVTLGNALLRAAG